jgi:hypothetical protein
MASAFPGTDQAECDGTRPGVRDLADLADLARGLRGMAHVADRFPSALPKVELGFRELADLARGCGEPGIRRIALAFASILGNAYRGPEGDIPLILDTAAAYLEALPSKLVRANGERIP